MKKAACFSILNSRMDHACFHSLNLKLLLSSADERWGRTPTQLQSRWFPSQLRILGFFIFISRWEKGSWPEAGKGDHNALSLLESSF
ncbi:uncharacterized protein LOC110935160 isoform X3 [Helianthus annuus]|uniref:uncharacterized protein LOC110935160 isoform X3 n=1 Tax=Helianthus annuus TaxID=4232 RepID=UPI000B90670A|nr:uncharacterized protein LOC110935160 isoform X3 [Helianthus annuus]